MPRPNFPKYGISSLYLFRWIQTREDYFSMTGVTPPTFDARRPPKYWEDPAALNSRTARVVYENVLAISENGTPLAGADGKPLLDVLVLSKQEAATVNIPPDKWPDAVMAAAPCPMRALEPGEVLFFDFGGVVAVKNLDHPYWNEAAGFTAADRALMQAIAQKLGVAV